MSKAKLVNAPTITTEVDESPADALARFYRELGWNGEDFLDTRKVRTTKAIFNALTEALCAKDPTNTGIGILMVHAGPGVDKDVPSGKVKLLTGWVVPAKNQISNSSAA
jgi:hypothetical protein